MCLNCGPCTTALSETGGSSGSSLCCGRLGSQGFTYGYFSENEKTIMSKRKPSLKKQIRNTPGISAQEMFKRANTELHSIRVSTPMLVFVQRMATDKVFRDKVTKLF